MASSMDTEQEERHEEEEEEEEEDVIIEAYSKVPTRVVEILLVIYQHLI